jgi:hypothetical protein
MTNPPSATRRILRSASLIGTAFVLVACLEAGWLPWNIRRALAIGDPGQPDVPASTIGRCHLKTDAHAWPAWLVEGLLTHQDDQATPANPVNPGPNSAAHPAGRTNRGLPGNSRKPERGASADG